MIDALTLPQVKQRTGMIIALRKTKKGRREKLEIESEKVIFGRSLFPPLPAVKAPSKSIALKQGALKASIAILAILVTPAA